MDPVWPEERVIAIVEKSLAQKVGQLTRLSTGFGPAKWIADPEAGRVLFKVVEGASKLQRVAQAVDIAVRGGVATPPILHSGLTHGESGFLIYEYWEGEDSESLLPLLSTEERAAFFSNLGSEVARLHRVTEGTFNWPETVVQRLDVLVERNQEAAVLSLSEIENAEQKLLKFLRLTGRQVSPGLIHGDLYPPNVLSCSRRFRAILDFDHAKLYDPVADFVKLRLWTFQSPTDETSFLRGYPLDAIDNFESRYSVCLGLELLAGFPYWKACGNEKLSAEYRRAFDAWL